MTRSISSTRLAIAAAHAEAALAVHAPDLVDAYTEALPVAAETVGRRLRGALVREDIGDARARNAGQGQPHAFDRVEFTTAGANDPVDLLGGIDAPGFATEVRNAVVNLAIAMARQRPTIPGLDRPDPTGPGLPQPDSARQNSTRQNSAQPDSGWRDSGWPGADRPELDRQSTDRPRAAGSPSDLAGLAADATEPTWPTQRAPETRPDDLADRLQADLDPDAAAVAGERLAVAGHNLHPCGRTRIGWDTTDVLAYDLETAHTTLGFVAIRDDRHLGDDVGAALQAAYPSLPEAPPGYRLQPVHPWQRDNILPSRHSDLLRDGTLRILDAELEAVPTAALRTLLLPPGADGHRRYVKVSLDIQVTSTRRSISVASTRNGPVVSALLHRLVADDPDGHRILLLTETAGAAVPAARSERDMSAILRVGLGGSVTRREAVIPGGALPFVAAGLIDAYAQSRNRPHDAGTARAWLDDYSRLLLPPLLRLTRHGVALEAHLQNCLPTFIGGVPHRLAVRDFAGLRLHPGRLAAAGHTVDLWPGSVVATGDEDVLRAKIGYTALQAHLGELVIRLGESHHLDEPTAWRTVRAVVDETYAELGADPVARADHAAFTAPWMPHKALVRMRLTGDGDMYLPVRNPLHAPA